MRGRKEFTGPPVPADAEAGTKVQMDRNEVGAARNSDEVIEGKVV